MRCFFLLWLFFTLALTACSSGDSSTDDHTYRISGHISGDYADLIYLLGDNVRDSAVVEDGRFVLTGPVDGPFQATLAMNGVSNATWIYVDDYDVTVTADYERQGDEGNPLHTLQNVVISGSPSDELYSAAQKQFRRIAPGDSTGERQYRYFLHLIDSTRSHPVIGTMLASAALTSPTMTADQLDTLITRFDTTRMDARAREAFAMGMATRKSYQVGDAFPDLPLLRPDGDTTRLSELRGLQVYVDIWASWCGPCRQQHPRLREIAAAIDGSNLVLVGISTDKDRGAWLEAMEQDDINWPSYHDAEHTMEKELAISAIPKAYLLNENGVIVQVDPNIEAYRDWMVP